MLNFLTKKYCFLFEKKAFCNAENSKIFRRVLTPKLSLIPYLHPIDRVPLNDQKPMSCFKENSSQKSILLKQCSRSEYIKNAGGPML